MTTRDGARRGLALYFALVVVGSALWQHAIYRTGEPMGSRPLLVIGLMWTPGVASVVTRLVRREGFRDVSFALRGGHGRRMMFLAWLYPLAVGAIAYGLAWSTGLDRFTTPKMAAFGLEHASAPAKLLASIAINLTIGTFFSAISAAGEEIGWRGYMLTRLIDAEIPRPLLVSGLIWGSWHLPLILTGQYASGPQPVLSAAMFLVSITGASYVAARVRLESGSLWPAIVFHSAWNALIQGTFDAFTVGGNAAHTTTIWTGESGIVLVAVDLLMALYLVWRPFLARRAPREEPFATLGVRNA